MLSVIYADLNKNYSNENNGNYKNIQLNCNEIDHNGPKNKHVFLLNKIK